MTTKTAQSSASGEARKPLKNPDQPPFEKANTLTPETSHLRGRNFKIAQFDQYGDRSGGSEHAGWVNSATWCFNLFAIENHEAHLNEVVAIVRKPRRRLDQFTAVQELYFLFRKWREEGWRVNDWCTGMVNVPEIAEYYRAFYGGPAPMNKEEQTIVCVDVKSSDWPADGHGNWATIVRVVEDALVNELGYLPVNWVFEGTEISVPALGRAELGQYACEMLDKVSRTNKPAFSFALTFLKPVAY